MKFKIASTVAVASIFALAPLAQAQDFLNLLQSYLGKNTTSITDQTQAISKTNINTRQAQLEADVNSGVTAGQLTTQEEAELRADLNRIGNLEGQYLVDGSYTGPEIQSMLTELSNFSVKLNTYLTNNTTAANSTYNSGWFQKYGHGRLSGFPTNQSQFQANIDTKQAQLDSAIENGTVSGRLNWNEARNLRVQLTRIANDETRYLADGRLSYTEAQQLISGLETLEQQLNRSLASSNQYLGNRHNGRSSRRVHSLIEQRIDAGISSGKLTRREADGLLRDQQRLIDLEAQLRVSGNRLTFTEQRRLIAERDQISRKLDKELNDRQVQ
jgi:hypothetical protein